MSNIKTPIYDDPIGAIMGVGAMRCYALTSNTLARLYMRAEREFVKEELLALQRLCQTRHGMLRSKWYPRNIETDYEHETAPTHE